MCNIYSKSKLNYVFLRYSLITHTMETAFDNNINKINQSHLRPTLLIGTTKEGGKNKINSNYNNMGNMNRLEINNPLCNWTKKDVWTFASSLYLPYKVTEEE